MVRIAKYYLVGGAIGGLVGAVYSHCLSDFSQFLLSPGSANPGWTSPRLAGAELRVYSPAGGFTHGDGATDFHSGI